MVVAQKPTDALAALKLGVLARWWRRPYKQSVLKALVIPLGMIVRDVLMNEVTQMALAKPGNRGNRGKPGNRETGNRDSLDYDI